MSKGTKRRGHGEGGLYQRESDGRWVGSVTIGRTPAGRQRCRVVYGRTKKEALDKLRELQKQVDIGTLASPSSLTVEGWLKRYSETVGRKNRETTQERERTIVNLHITPYLGAVRLNRLSLVALEGWLADLERDGRSAWNQAKAASVLSTALRKAVKMKLLPFNPAAELTKPRPPEKEVEIYSEAEANRLMATSQCHRLHALYVVALTSGMRQGELFGLHWPEVDFERSTVKVKHTLRLLNGQGFSLQPPKSKKGRRTIDLPQVAMAALLNHRELMTAEGRDVETGPVFVGRRNNFISKGNFHTLHGKMLARAGLPFRKFHALRHTHASILLARGRSLRAVSERLGHSRPEMTLQVYAHLMPGDGQETARVLDATFANYATALDRAPNGDEKKPSAEV